jgi:carboxypeptidase PM20D1
LAGAIRIPTITAAEGADLPRDAFAELHRYLQDSFPRVHEHLERETVEEWSLLYTWKGTSPDLEPIVLMGHLDVVPVEGATLGSWTHPPFSGAVADGHVWGRGSMDLKVSVLASLEAVEALLGRGFRPARTILLAFGHDEEVGGRGAEAIVSLLARRGTRPALVVDEGLAILDGLVPGLSPPVALVGLAEKGNVSLEISAATEGGHSSVPPPRTAAEVVSEAVVRLQSRPHAARLAGASRAMFEGLAPHAPFRWRLLFRNLWLFSGLLAGRLAAQDATATLVRTTGAVTILASGVKENILPKQARAVVNYRILPGDSVAEVLVRARRAARELPVKIQALGDGREPTPPSRTDSWGYRILARVIERVFPDAVLAPGLVVGGTDSRHYAAISDSVYRFLPLRVRAADLARIHGVDERLSVENYGEILRFYRELIEEGGIPTPEPASPPAPSARRWR